MSTDKKTLIITEYAEYPGPRYCEQGDKSGEDFYHIALNDAFAEVLQDNKKLSVILDGTAGYASSFLDEAFGNLVFDFTLEKVKDNIEIISEEEPDWKEMILNETLPQWEVRRLENDKPTVTRNHEPWYRLHNGKYVKETWIPI